MSFKVQKVLYLSVQALGATHPDPDLVPEFPKKRADHDRMESFSSWT
jgi:hypothetical protein